MARGLQDAWLSPGQLEIMRQLAKGRTPKQIAADAGKSPWTVWNQISRMEKRLGSNGYDLVYKGYQMGLLNRGKH